MTRYLFQKEDAVPTAVPHVAPAVAAPAVAVHDARGGAPDTRYVRLTMHRKSDDATETRFEFKDIVYSNDQFGDCTHAFLTVPRRPQFVKSWSRADATAWLLLPIKKTAKPETGDNGAPVYVYEHAKFGDFNELQCIRHDQGTAEEVWTAWDSNSKDGSYLRVNDIFAHGAATSRVDTVTRFSSSPNPFISFAMDGKSQAYNQVNTKLDVTRTDGASLLVYPLISTHYDEKLNYLTWRMVPQAAATPETTAAGAVTFWKGSYIGQFTKRRHFFSRTRTGKVLYEVYPNGGMVQVASHKVSDKMSKMTKAAHHGSWEEVSKNLSEMRARFQVCFSSRDGSYIQFYKVADGAKIAAKDLNATIAAANEVGGSSINTDAVHGLAGTDPTLEADDAATASNQKLEAANAATVPDQKLDAANAATANVPLAAEDGEDADEDVAEDEEDADDDTGDITSPAVFGDSNGVELNES